MLRLLWIRDEALHEAYPQVTAIVPAVVGMLDVTVRVRDATSNPLRVGVDCAPSCSDLR